MARHPHAKNKTLSDAPVEEESPKPVVPTPLEKKKVPLEERVLDPKTPPLIVKKGFVGILLLVTLIAITLGVVLTLRGQGAVAGAKTSLQADQRDIAKLMNKVRQHFLLPEGEQATIATVSDVTKLEKNEFFSKALNGDKVIIYPYAGLAILYRPSVDKIVAVGPVLPDEGQARNGAVRKTPASAPITPTGTFLPPEEPTPASGRHSAGSSATPSPTE